MPSILPCAKTFINTFTHTHNTLTPCLDVCVQYLHVHEIHAPSHIPGTFTYTQYIKSHCNIIHTHVYSSLEKWEKRVKNLMVSSSSCVRFFCLRSIRLRANKTHSHSNCAQSDSLSCLRYACIMYTFIYISYAVGLPFV